MIQGLCDILGVGRHREEEGYWAVSKFIWQIGLRRSLHGKESSIGSLIDFQKDFQVSNSYEGPRLEQDWDNSMHQQQQQQQHQGEGRDSALQPTGDTTTTTTISDEFVQSALECFSHGGVYTGSATPPGASANEEAGAGGEEASEDKEEKCTPPSPPPVSPVPPSPKKKNINSFGMHRKYVYRVLQQMETFYRAPENASLLVDVKVPKNAVINICGDIHGQFYDLLKIFREKGPPSDTNLYLFNGDIVDKGPMSIECILYLFLLKLTRPTLVFINRGNHESATLNIRSGFTKEVRVKSGGDNFLPRYFAEIFRWMPLGHVINDRILVVHGGLSSNLALKLDDIRAIKKPTDPRVGSLTGDLLWSDPVSRPGVSASARGIGVFFGPDVTRRFLDNNDLLCVIRSHSEIKAGCGLNHDGCYTVYSAPSVAKGVKGGVLTVEGNYLAKEGCVFTECTREEVEEFRRGGFHKQEPSEKEERDEEAGARGTLPKRL